MTQIEPVPYPHLESKDQDPFAVFCAIIDKILERDIEVPNEIIGRLIEQIKCKL